MTNSIKLHLVASGEHKGWWCAEFGGVGVYGLTRESAIINLKAVLC